MILSFAVHSLNLREFKFGHQTVTLRTSRYFLVVVAAAAAVQVARLSSETESSSQTNDCAHLRQQCLIDTNGCEQSWRAMEDTCIVPGKT